MWEWWEIMESMQIPDPDRARGTRWSDMEEVFHQNQRTAPSVDDRPLGWGRSLGGAGGGAGSVPPAHHALFDQGFDLLFRKAQLPEHLTGVFPMRRAVGSGL